ALIFLLKLHVPRNFSLASMAPGRPKVKQHNSALVVGQADRCTRSVGKGKRRCDLSGIGLSHLCNSSWRFSTTPQNKTCYECNCYDYDTFGPHGDAPPCDSWFCYDESGKRLRNPTEK